MLRLWNAKTGKRRHVLKGHTDPVRFCCFSPNGKILVSASFDKTMRMWDVKSGKEKALLRNPGVIESCSFSPNGKKLAFASTDHTVRLWDIQTGNVWPTLIGHTDSVSSCAFSPDGEKIASASFDKTMRLWNAKTGKMIAVFPCIGAGRVCVFSPSGKTLAVGDEGGNVYILELIHL